MSQLSKKILLLIFGLLLIFSFLILIIGSYITLRYPDQVISFIETLKPEEETEPFTPIGVAVVGDSLSDEYRGDDSRGLTYASTTLNWIEQLEKYRNINFGEWGTWGEPRRTGYAYNWARTGATVASMLESGQDAGVVEQIKKGEVNLVIVYIGANDFAPYITKDGYDAIYNGSVTERQLLRKKNIVVADIVTTLDTIRQAGKIKILLIKIPDWGNHFGIRVGFPIPEQRKRISDTVTAANEDLQVIADSRGITTLDPNQFYKDVFQGNASTITVGNESFNAILPSDDPRSVFLDDGVHAGTVLNALFANFVITTLNKEVGTSIKPFTTEEILQHAGL